MTESLLTALRGLDESEAKDFVKSRAFELLTVVCKDTIVRLGEEFDYFRLLEYGPNAIVERESILGKRLAVQEVLEMLTAALEEFNN